VPPPREKVTTKVYRREEDPEIAEQQAQDLQNAERAGLVPSGEVEAEEEAPKAVSLKERIALLQKQQAEQASRRGEAAAKEKPKRPPKKRVDQESEEHAVAESTPRESSDMERVNAEPRKIPRSKPTEPIISDGNDADQSAAGETTEAEGTSTGLDEEEEKYRAPAQHVEEQEEEDAEEEEEDDMDEEARHQMALRERMAKLSGGMGMPGMFGMPMPGMAPPKKKKVEKPMEQEREATSPVSAPRIPIMPMPSLSRANTTDSAEDTTKPYDDDEVDEDEPLPLASPPLPVSSRPKVERGRALDLVERPILIIQLLLFQPLQQFNPQAPAPNPMMRCPGMHMLKTQ
jgi:myosin tail region-interacting protein MTI1